jgi:hypothetical protein
MSGTQRCSLRKCSPPVSQSKLPQQQAQFKPKLEAAKRQKGLKETSCLKALAQRARKGEADEVR